MEISQVIRANQQFHRELLFLNKEIFSFSKGNFSFSWVKTTPLTKSVSLKLNISKLVGIPKFGITTKNHFWTSVFVFYILCISRSELRNWPGIIHFVCTQNFQKKLACLAPMLRPRTCAYKVVKKLVLSKNFAYALNEWFLKRRIIK